MKSGIWALGVIALILAGCGEQTNVSEPTGPITRKSLQGERTEAAVAPSSVPTTHKKGYPRFTYPYDMEEDRKDFDPSQVDIVVGDKLYMTQINDWFIHFKDYEDKRVCIEGYFLTIDGHTFVGRNGPTCPYCTGGYVDFEFRSDQDLSRFEHGVSWIRVYGILRRAAVQVDEEITVPFYHIEALRVEEAEYTGKGTITD